MESSTDKICRYIFFFRWSSSHRDVLSVEINGPYSFAFHRNALWVKPVKRVITHYSPHRDIYVLLVNLLVVIQKLKALLRVLLINNHLILTS